LLKDEVFDLLADAGQKIEKRKTETKAKCRYTKQKMMILNAVQK
jgi:hypothetical protein